MVNMQVVLIKIIRTGIRLITDQNISVGTSFKYAIGLAVKFEEE